MAPEITKFIGAFEMISLSEMDDVALQKRTDTKFVLSVASLLKVLSSIKSQYRILEINDQRLMQYNTLYFDTPESKFYLDHHNGKIKRTKIRMRKYVESNLHFLEVKIKDGRGNTNKSRSLVSKFEDELSPVNRSFIEEVTGVKYELNPVLSNNFNRMTLVNIENKERVTIDLNLTYAFNNKEKKLAEIAIVEIKQARYNTTSPMFQALKNNGVRSIGFSKYCMGMTQLYTNLKYNAFKPKQLRINKITA